MSSAIPGASRALPESPDLRHLRHQARDLLRAGEAKSLADAQFRIARSYGFESWPKLKAHVDLLHEGGQLKDAINRDDLDQVRALMTRNPSLHRAPIGYGGDGPLTWAAECRGTSGPSPGRLAIARWMILNGSDVHQGGDGPLMRAALRGERIPMMELLVRHGADVNALWHGRYPILFAPCESVNSAPIAWLLKRGADPNVRGSQQEAPLDYVLGTYGRSNDLAGCIDVLVAAGGRTHFDLPGVLDLLSGKLNRLEELLRKTPDLVHRRWPQLRFGSTGGRGLLLAGGTLLHVAAEFGNVEAAQLLLAHGADANAQATVDEKGVGGQTPIFHCVSQYNDWGLGVTHLLLQAGAGVSVRARIPGTYGNADEIVDCTPLEYAQRFPGSEFPGSNEQTLRLLASAQVS